MDSSLALPDAGGQMTPTTVSKLHLCYTVYCTEKVFTVQPPGAVMSPVQHVDASKMILMFEYICLVNHPTSVGEHLASFLDF